MILSAIVTEVRNLLLVNMCPTEVLTEWVEVVYVSIC